MLSSLVTSVRTMSMPKGLVHRRAEINGVATAWVERPATERLKNPAPLVLIPGLSMSWRAFTWLLQEQSADRPIYIVDAPGAGRSARLPRRMNSEAQAQHLAAWLDHMHLTDIDLIGHSLGAVTAARLAAAAPARVRSVALVSPSPDDRMTHVWQHAAALLRGLRHENPRVIVQAVFDYVRSDPRILLGFRDEIARSATDVMADVRAPVTVVRGSQDRVSGQEWCAELAHAGAGSLVVVPDAAHGLPQDRPAALASVLRRSEPQPPNSLRA